MVSYGYLPTSRNPYSAITEIEVQPRPPTRADRTYKRNGYYVIFVHLYKVRKKWKNFLIERIMEIEEKRHYEVMKMLIQIQF